MLTKLCSLSESITVDSNEAAAERFADSQPLCMVASLQL